ncbi:MAG: regulatory protein RecX [Bacteriovoracaceae bacterium]
MTEAETKKLLNYAYRLLARQDYSEHKLRQKLKLRAELLECGEEQINQVIETLNQQGFLREDNYRNMKIKMRLKQGKGKRIIQGELSSEKLKLEESHLEQAYLELGTTSDEILEGLVEKKLRKVNKEELNFEEKMKLKNKILSFLARNGHSFEAGQRILKKFL